MADSAASSEEEVKKYLREIEEAASDRELAAANYLFRALLPDKDNPKKLVEWYTLLRQSKDYYQTALSLVSVVVEDACPNEDKLVPIRKVIQEKTDFNTEKSLPRFVLRKMLFTVLNDLPGDEIEELITRMCDLHLKVHRDRFGAGYEATLKLFERMENESLFKVAGEKQLKPLQDFLDERRLNLIKKRLHQYDPNQKQQLAVINVEILPGSRSIQDAISDKDFYHNLLVETYKEMPVIPLNQWPPVRKEHYVTLALITNEAMSRHDIFSRGTIRGSVDDVYKKKVPAEFGDVFPKKLSSDKRWMVLIEGRPGSGKSTMVTKVSKDWAEGKLLQDVELFILVRLRRFLGKENITLRDIFGVFCDNAGVVSSVVDEITKNGGKGVCFAFDGLDEYSAVFKKGNLIYELIHALKLPRASIFMTSRPAGSHKLRNSTRLKQNVEIIGFLEEEVERYIKEYYIERENPEYVKAADLLKYLKSHPNIARMCYLPLHMAMVVYLHEINPDYLPNTETELYKAFVLQTLFRALQREAANPDDEDEIELHEFAYLPVDKKPIFKGTCQLAFEATAQQKQIFTGKEILESELPMVVPNKKEFDSLGLLTVDRMTAASSLPTKTFSFLHLTLQEFLSAVYLVDHLDQDEQLKVIQEHAGKVHMWVVWKFYSGLSSQRKSSIFLNAFHSIVAQNVSQGLAGLSMMHCAFESQRNEACVDVLSQLGGQVNVQDITLNASDCATIGYVAIHAHQVLTYLDLSYCHLGPSGIEAFVQQLETSDEKLGKVGLLRMRARTDFNPVGSEGAPSLVKFLKKLPNLGELRLYGNKLKTEKFRFFVPVISDMKRLHTLILSRNDLETSTGELVSQILGNLELLHTFYISYNPLKDDGLGAMKPGLLKCLNLKILGLRGTHLTEGAGIHLREILETLPKLEWIELYQNSLGDQGVIDMLPGLFKAKSLQMLSLVENGISDKGAVSFAAYLKSTDTLREMRMYYNHEMSDVGKIALRTAVVERPPSKCELKFAV